MPYLKIKDKERYIVLAESNSFAYLQSIYELTYPLNEDKVIALVSGVKEPSEYFSPNKIL